MFEKNEPIRSWQYTLFILGVSLCLLGAFLMVVGEGILAENHSGIAAVVGISGIGLIARARNCGKKQE